MIVSTTLLKDLQKRVTLLEEDLRQRCDADPQVNAPLQAQYAAARESKRTAETFNAWRDEQITQIAVAWVLACVFVRFLEDNRLLDTPFLVGPDAARMNRARDEQELFFKHHPTASERDYLLHVFDALGQLPGMREFFDRRHNPLWLAGPTGDALAGLLDFWRKTDPDTGALAHDFTDPDWNTRFLGDLYQDLSEFARKRYALLQTPEFVEQFILDRTLTPAIDTFGYRVVRMLDLTCGSGHFLLGGFGRLFKLWQEHEPGENPRVLAQRALDQVSGVDLNPNVVAIARFRLLLATLKACQPASDAQPLKLKDAPDLKIHLAVGDSLLHGARFAPEEKQAQQQTFGGDELFRDELHHFYDTEDRDALHRILGRQYHVVVGNPPYITVKDKALNQLYRDRFDSCHQKYSLAVPFMERFFDLAIRGEPALKWDPFAKDRPAPLTPHPSPLAPPALAGFVGMITANSFMKREFGKKLIEECIPRWDLTHVIDTSGAYIPGHGTPTVILLGKHQPPVAATIRTVMGIKGEPATPEEPERGLVWSAILRQVDQPGSESDFVSVADTARESFHKHPWSIGGGGAAELKQVLDECAEKTLKEIADQVGITAVTGEDDLYLLPDRATAHRLGIEKSRSVAIGDLVRDWVMENLPPSIWLYDDDFHLLRPHEFPRSFRLLWYCKAVISRRKRFGTPMVERGLTWFEWQELYTEKLRTPLTIAFAEVASHNHFVMDRGGKVFKNTAPVIKLTTNSSEDEHFALLGFLNSALVCFRMKQTAQQKQMTGGDGVRVESRAKVPYQYASTQLLRLPIPAGFLSGDLRERLVGITREAESLAQELARLSVSNVIPDFLASGTNFPEQWAAVARTREGMRARLAFLQEQADFTVYAMFGIAERSLLGVEADAPDFGVQPGQRPFEILAGENIDGFPVPSSVPSIWPQPIRTLWQRRMEAIVSTGELKIIEDPHYKRRWIGRQGLFNHAVKANEIRDALGDWLLNRLEGYFFEGDRVCRLEDGFSPAADGFRAATQPALVSTNQLAELVQADAAFLKVAEVYVGAAGFSVPKLVRELVESESVPFLPFQRYKESGLRKRQDWERTWELQRKEDEFDAQIEPLVKEVEDVVKKLSKDAESPEAPKWKARKEALGEEIRALKDDKAREVGVIPVPPKYASADFKSSTFCRLRGKLDVPKERWVSYPGAERDGDPSPVIAWAGWNHLQQAQALAEYYLTAKDTWGWSPDRLQLLLAGLADLLSWLKKWHNEMNPEYGMALGDYFAGFLDEECRKNGTTVAAAMESRLSAGG